MTFETVFEASVKPSFKAVFKMGLKAAFLAGQNYFRIYLIGESSWQS
ncbi:hypothetical protein [Burkholderia sp. Ax-1724]|nr:hypothetical protein [Burkholderia sp. Ax-1724]